MTLPTLRRCLLFSAAASLLIFAGCRRMSGTYEKIAGVSSMSFNFKSSDKVDMLVKDKAFGDKTVECTYVMDGDKVSIHPPLGGGAKDLVFTVQPDGSLSPDGGTTKFVKK